MILAVGCISRQTLSAWRGGLCPNGYVHNPTTYIDPLGLIEEILSNKSITYRGDTRSPQKIFSEGFVTKGTNTDLHRYGMLNEPSVFVSSSKDFKIAREFAMETARSTGQSTGWVYTINNTGNGIDMNSSLRGEGYFYGREREVAFKGGVKPENIVLAMEFDANTGEVIRKVRNSNFKPVKLTKICRK